jgi:hypothetical protein
MSSKPELYYPLFAPPAADGVNAPTYYSGLGTTAQVTGHSGGGLAITFTNPDGLYPTGQFTEATALSAVFAPTEAWVTFYPAAESLVTPGNTLLQPPAGVSAPDAGSLVLEIWPTGFRKLGTSKLAADFRPTHLVIGGVARFDVAAALRKVVEALPLSTVKKAWEDSGGTGTPSRQTLDDSYLTDVMTESSRLYVKAGVRLGAATTYLDTNSNSTMGWLQWRTYVSDDQGNFADTDAMQLLDDIYSRARVEQPGSIYEAHPLVQATAAERPVQVQSIMKIWDKTISPRGFIPFANEQVTFLRNGTPLGALHASDATGAVSFTETLSPRDKIQFEYQTSGKTIGGRAYTKPLRTKSQRLGPLLGAGDIVSDPFYGKYSLYEDYEVFWAEMAANEVNEKFEEDRGNAVKPDNAKHAGETRRLDILRDSEIAYRQTPSGKQPFNVLYEGDSWMNYPFTFDTFRQLHDLIKGKIDKSVYQYNAFPLQHFGDRADQMFADRRPVPSFLASAPPTKPRQWEFTQAYLDEYPIDVIILSAGGNDIAEPGISYNDKTKAPYDNPAFWNGKDNESFNPTAAAAVLGATSADMDKARELMFRSFSILLANHPWNVYERVLSGTLPPPVQDAEPAMTAAFATLFTTMADQFGGASASRAAIAAAVRDRFPSPTSSPPLNFPTSITSTHDQLAAKIFDAGRLIERYQNIKSSIEILLAEANTRNIPVLTHTYSYTFFKELPTLLKDEWDVDFGKGKKYENRQSGPWLYNRLTDANIVDPRVRMIAIKAVLDCFQSQVIAPLKLDYPNTLEVADVRTAVDEAKYWRDEMHLETGGFKCIAEGIYTKLQTMFSTKLDLL